MKKLILAMAALGLLAAESPALALSTNTLSVTASVNSTCVFSSGTSALNFGALDPASTANATSIASTTFWCTKGATYSITNDNGLHSSGTTIRMQNAVDLTQFIPYTLAYTNTGTGLGKNTPLTLNITGTIQNVDYINAAAGNYADSVVLTVTP